MKAIKSPICIFPADIRIPPNQIIATTVKFINNIINGIRNAINLFTLINLFVKFSFAVFNLFASVVSLLKARKHEHRQGFRASQDSIYPNAFELPEIMAYSF